MQCKWKKLLVQQQAVLAETQAVLAEAQPAITCLKLTIETVEQGVKYVKS